MNEINNNSNCKYYLRDTGVFVKVDFQNVLLKCLNNLAEWEENQEWFMEMFVDGDGEIQFSEILEKEVLEYQQILKNDNNDINTKIYVNNLLEKYNLSKKTLHK